MNFKITLLFIVALMRCFVFADDTTTTELKNIISYDSNVYVIYTDESMQKGGVVITNVRSEDFRGINCIVGEGLKSWIKGKIILIPKERIIAIFKFSSKDDYMNSIKKMGFSEKKKTKKRRRE